MHEATTGLLNRAADDLKVASSLETPDAPFGQHIHAAMEKYFKALLNELGDGFPYTHDLKTLRNLLQNKGEAIPVVSITFSELNYYASKFRYEDNEGVKPLNRQELLEAVNIIRDYVLGRIEQLSAK